MLKKIGKCWLVLAVLLVGCRQSPPVAWEAEADIEAYVDYKYNSQVVKFKLVRGDICTPGREEYSKIFAFREVVCPRRGVGWVKSREFMVFDASHPGGSPLKR